MKHILVCDVDDCLIKTDLLYEQWLILLKKNPFLFLLSPFWLFKGLAYFKNRIAKAAPIHPQSLPYRASVIAYLKNAKEEKTTLVLASASPHLWVQPIANHLGLFTHVIGSREDKNLKGTAKLQAIKEHIGSETFAYIGDSRADLPIWQEAAEIIAVNPKSSTRAQINKMNKPTTFLDDPKVNVWKLTFKQIRPHQWIKNLLVFLPALAGHRYSLQTAENALFAYAGFCMAASFVYVLNDLLDLRADRNHHTKKNRPFASGNLPVKWGLVLMPMLLLACIWFSSALPAGYAGWISTYLVLNLAYSLYLKQSVIVDVIILSMMYTLRIFAGSAATDVPVSEWLLSFSTLFFFSLACVKRYTEIIRSKNKITLDGRGYRQVDHSMVQSLGVGSGLIAVLIFLLYLQSQDVRALYNNEQTLWFATPILLFWISRIWILTNRDEINDDPVVFAVKDRVSWICLALLALVMGISL